jgi:hypothetical protein
MITKPIQARQSINLPKGENYYIDNRNINIQAFNNLIGSMVNGTFESDTNGWIVKNASIEHLPKIYWGLTGGCIKLTNSIEGKFSGLSRKFILPNGTYIIGLLHMNGTKAGYVSIGKFEELYPATIGGEAMDYTWTRKEYEVIVSNNEPLWISFWTNGTSLNDTSYWSDVTIELTNLSDDTFLKDYNLVFADYFRKINPNIWRKLEYAETFYGRPEQLLNRYVNKNVYVDREGLHIKAERVGNEYHSGLITTQGKKEWTYGYFEAKIRYPNVPGIWCQFFTVNSVGWPPEIDSGESFTNDGILQFAIRKEEGVDYPVRHNFGPNFLGKWHVFGILWESDKVIIYVDNEEQVRYSWSPSLPMNCFFILGMNEWYESDDSKLPVTFDVEYLKIWQKR